MATIRPGRSDELDALAVVEIDASDAFAALGLVLPDATAATPRPLMEATLAEGLLFVAADAADRPIGFVACHAREGWLYVGEIDVLRAFQRRGIGRRLLAAALDAGRSRGLSGAMLTTFRDVPFNGPFYASVGFRTLEGDECPAWLAAVLAGEITAGHDPARRVGMALRFG